MKFRSLNLIKLIPLDSIIFIDTRDEISANNSPLPSLRSFLSFKPSTWVGIDETALGKQRNSLNFAITQSIVSNLDVCSASSYFPSQTSTMSAERWDSRAQKAISLTKQLLQPRKEEKNLDKNLQIVCFCHPGLFPWNETCQDCKYFVSRWTVTDNKKFNEFSMFRNLLAILSRHGTLRSPESESHKRKKKINFTDCAKLGFLPHISRCLSVWNQNKT